MIVMGDTRSGLTRNWGRAIVLSRGREPARLLSISKGHLRCVLYPKLPPFIFFFSFSKIPKVLNYDGVERVSLRNSASIDIDI